MHIAEDLYRAAQAQHFFPLGAPGLTGTIKAAPEDFEVEELPAYEPSGEGEHLFVFVQKRNLASFDFVREFARGLGCAVDDVALAGMKDAIAITRQWVCVPARLEGALAATPFACHPNIDVLHWARHGNKLKTGHLRGNRFSIRVRDVAAAGGNAAFNVHGRVAALVADVRDNGFVNAYGSQRFGRRGETIALGFNVLGIRDAPRAPRLGKKALRLALSAVQAALFNAYLGERDAQGTLRTLAVGDVALVRASQGPFVVDDAASANARLAAGELVLGGPLYGPKMRAARGDAHAQEMAVLQRFGIELETFQRFAKLTAGGRRPAVCWPSDLEFEFEGADLLLRFVLPAGCYATQLLSALVVDDAPAGLAEKAPGTEAN